MTATFNKPLQVWKVTKECQLYWDIEDEQICKNMFRDTKTSLMKLEERHGKEYIEKIFLQYAKMGYRGFDNFGLYKNMPELHIITNMFDSQRYEILKTKLNAENKMGFCFEALFALK